MPRYDYQCTSCDHKFELVQSFSEAGSGTCPVCSGDGRRVFHAVPVIYKGSGFYTTDYGRPKTPPAEGREKDGADSSEKKSAGSGSDSNSNGAETKSDTAAAKTAAESAA